MTEKVLNNLYTLTLPYAYLPLCKEHHGLSKKICFSFVFAYEIVQPVTILLLWHIPSPSSEPFTFVSRMPKIPHTGQMRPSAADYMCMVMYLGMQRTENSCRAPPCMVFHRKHKSLVLSVDCAFYSVVLFIESVMAFWNL